MVNKIYDMSGKRINSNPPIYNLRICLIGSDDLDIKNIETFGVAEDGFFMVKAKSNPRFPIFMTNPMRIKTVEVYTNNEKPLTKLGEEKSDDDFLMDLLRRQHDSTSKTKKD